MRDDLTDSWLDTRVTVDVEEKAKERAARATVVFVDRTSPVPYPYRVRSRAIAGSDRLRLAYQASDHPALMGTHVSDEAEATMSSVAEQQPYVPSGAAHVVASTSAPLIDDASALHLHVPSPGMCRSHEPGACDR